MQGIPIANFLNDGLGAGKSKCQAKIWSLVVHSDLLKCAFCINESKSQWEPFQGIVWLGYVIDTIAQSIQVTEKRINKLLLAIGNLISDHCKIVTVHVKDLASVVGQVISMEIVVGNTVRLMTRSAYRAINVCTSWASSVKLDPSTLDELYFWHENSQHLNSKKLWGGKCNPLDDCIF